MQAITLAHGAPEEQCRLRVTMAASARPSTRLLTSISVFSKRRKTRGKRRIESGGSLNSGAGSSGAAIGNRQARASFSAECSVVFQNAQVIEGSADEGLEIPAFQIHIFDGINAGLLRLAQGVRTQHPEADDQNIRPFHLHLREQIATLSGAQIEQEKSRAVLLEHGVEPVGLIHVAELAMRSRRKARVRLTKFGSCV